MMDPKRQIPQPNLPKTPSFSLKNTEAKTAPIMTERAPRGVTRIGGANVYAAKLAISPIAIIVVPTIQMGFLRYVRDSPLDPSFNSPIFVKTKDDPIAKDELIAKNKPTYLSSIVFGQL